jgi:hypothetical protein
MPAGMAMARQGCELSKKWKGEKLRAVLGTRCLGYRFYIL